jgi:hypothetical protein
MVSQASVSARRRPPSSLVRSAAGVAVAVGVIAAAAWPIVFSNATFNEAWLEHLWYMWHQSIAIREHHTPGLFLDYSGGVFYPLYAFYGGTLYALVGTLSLLLGNAPLDTYILTYLLGFAAAYGGFYWTCRIFGVQGWVAHVPGLVFVTSAGYLSIIYALGDWPEFLATSMMPLMVAGGVSVLRASRLRLGPAIALTSSSVVFFGSHLLTLIWGSTSLAVVAVALLVCVPGVRARMTGAGVLRVAALVVPALLLSAWFLVPTAAYESHTVIASSYVHSRVLLREAMSPVAVRNLFTFSRPPISTYVFPLALPILAVAWVLASIPLFAWAGRRGTWMRALLVIAAATAALGVVMTHAGLILALPRPYAALQYSFRLESFVLLGISAAMIPVLVMARDAGPRLRRWTWLLAPIATASIIGALEQADGHLQGYSRSTALASFQAPPSERFSADYLDERLRIDDAPLPLVEFPLATVAIDGRAAMVVQLPRDRLVATNIRSGPDFVRVTGAKVVGVDKQLDDVLEVTGGASRSRIGSSADAPTPARAVKISVGPADRRPVVVGRAISLIALVALAGELVWIGVRGVRLRRRPAR